MNIGKKMRIFREHVENGKIQAGISRLLCDVVIIRRQSSQVEKILSRIPTDQQLRNKKSNMDLGGRQHTSPGLDTQFERRSAYLNAMRNKVTQRQTLFQAPLLPGRWNPFKLRPHVEDHRDVQLADRDRRTMEPYPVSPGSRRSESRSRFHWAPDRCNLVTELLRQRLTFLPGALQGTRAAHRDRQARGQSSVLCQKGKHHLSAIWQNCEKAPPECCCFRTLRILHEL